MATYLNVQSETEPAIREEIKPTQRRHKLKVTAQEIIKKSPCNKWTEKKISKFIGGGKTLFEILDLGEVQVKDRIWCVTKFLPDKINRKFAIWCARQCKTKIKEIIEYINVIKKYYNGAATVAELRAADRAAYNVADRAAYNAADRAAYNAADRAAYNAADRAAYWAADRAAYWAANRAAGKSQIAKLKKLLKEAV